MGEPERLTKSLIAKQEADNASCITNDRGGMRDSAATSSGAGAAVRPSDSSATVTLIVSTFVVACGAFTGGCLVSPSTSSAAIFNH